MNSISLSALNTPSIAIQWHLPWLFTDETIENLCREPHTARVVGVVPRGEYDRPRTSVFITAVSSAQWISAFSVFARAEIAGYSSASHFFTASGFCS
jgi:hypothetical protein